MDLSKLHSELSKDDNISIFIKLPILAFSSWLFQGMLYMDKTERVFKICLDALLIVCLYAIVNPLSDFGNLIILFVSIAIAHTLNWLFNGQIFVLLKNLRLSKNESKRFFQYLEELQSRIKNEYRIQSAAAFGSLSRETLKETSDLDIRIIRKPGVFNGIRACFFVLRERCRGLFSKFPIDIFVLDGPDSLDKLNDDEKPIILHDSDNELIRFYNKRGVKFWKS